jgi:hypothetical protein
MLPPQNQLNRRYALWLPYYFSCWSRFSDQHKRSRSWNPVAPSHYSKKSYFFLPLKMCCVNKWHNVECAGKFFGTTNKITRFNKIQTIRDALFAILKFSAVRLNQILLIPLFANPNTKFRTIESICIKIFRRAGKQNPTTAKFLFGWWTGQLQFARSHKRTTRFLILLSWWSCDDSNSDSDSKLIVFN